MTFGERAKLTLRQVLDRYGFELRYQPSLNLFLKFHDIDLVLDVGANLGQFAKQIRERGYAGEIWSYEPTSAAFATAEKESRFDQHWSLFNWAFGMFRAKGNYQCSLSK
ncbi:hypothetical protein [Novosphingobium sp. Gsoil 351]|uniref:hypothetical protein n=1 Tax=Novosphingobium sp. Gsoil 351 TaxID=2675225 RepID=UPI0012B4C968|nr:hypothetical protein [Novosphingobium sp. Gsoil 351]QGN55421.1 hypothetical protein GKE62_13565 [Novosphingobium sp. Gsoil 351]